VVVALVVALMVAQPAVSAAAQAEMAPAAALVRSPLTQSPIPCLLVPDTGGTVRWFSPAG
jgi:hypothetical protein